MNEIAQQEVSKSRKYGLVKQPIVLFTLLLVVFGSITARLFWLQVLQGSFYRKLSDENRIRLISRPPVRGRLLDLRGKTLADSKVTYALSIQPRLVSNEEWPSLRDGLSSLLTISKDSMDQRFREGVIKDPFRITLANDLSPEQVLRFTEKESSFKGAQVDVELIRSYPYGTLASHALGYTQSITQKEFNILREKGYEMSDRIGRTGVEAAYEQILRGKWGGEMLEVDAAGNVQRSLGFKSPESGKDLVLTIDLGLQLAAEKALEGKFAGAVVVLDPRTGAIRAMASRPNFDPNFFSKSFTIADDVEIKGAELKDGLLRVTLERIIPENKKPRTITIK